MNTTELLYLTDTCDSSETKDERIEVELAHTYPSSIFLTVSDRDGNDHFTVCLDFFDGQLSARIWQPEDQGGDPRVIEDCSSLDNVLKR